MHFKSCIEIKIKLNSYFYFFVVPQKVLSYSQETDSLETRTELAVVRTHVENQAILEPILL